jgi:hypothetical protein
LPHPLITHLSQCQCGHTSDDLGTHLLRCPYTSEHTIAHNTLWNIVAIIALESGTHVQRGVSHLFLHHTQQVDNLITRNDFWTLMDIIIDDSTRTYRAQLVLTTIAHVTTMVA